MNPLLFFPLYPGFDPAYLGQLPLWLSPDNEGTAEECINRFYPFGGFQPFEGFTLVGPQAEGWLKYPGDPIMKPLAKALRRNASGTELIFFYSSDWLAIFQPDKTFKIARID